MSGFVLERKLGKCAIGRVVGALRVGGKPFKRFPSYPDNTYLNTRFLASLETTVTEILKQVQDDNTNTEIA